MRYRFRLAHASAEEDGEAVIDMEEVVVGFPTRKPDQVECRFGTTTVFDPYPIPPHLHVSGTIVHALNQLPRASGLRAAQHLADITDEADGGRGVLWTIDALEGAFGCTVADRGFRMVQDAPQFAVELAGRLARDGTGPWLGMEVTERGLPPLRRGRNAGFWYASIGGVYSGSLRHSCMNALVQDRIGANLDRLAVDIPKPPSTPEVDYGHSVASLLAQAVALVGYLYIKDERRFPDSSYTFQTVSSATRDAYRAALAERPDDD